MERHAAVPDFDGPDGISGNGRQIVKQDVTDAPAEHDAAGCPENEIVKMLGRDGRDVVRPHSIRAGEAPRVKPAEHDARDIGNAVPVYRQRPDGQRYRIDIGNGMMAREVGAGYQSVYIPSSLLGGQRIDPLSQRAWR